MDQLTPPGFGTARSARPGSGADSTVRISTAPMAFFLLAYHPDHWEVVEIEGERVWVPDLIFQPIVPGVNGTREARRPGGDPDYRIWRGRIEDKGGVVLDGPIMSEYLRTAKVLPPKGNVLVEHHYHVGGFPERAGSKFHMRVNTDIWNAWRRSLCGRVDGIPEQPDPGTARSILNRKRQRVDVMLPMLGQSNAAAAQPMIKARQAELEAVESMTGATSTAPDAFGTARGETKDPPEAPPPPKPRRGGRKSPPA